eukprot:g73191.t1
MNWQDFVINSTSRETIVARKPATATTKVTVQMWFVDGLSNDIARVFIDGQLAFCGTTWENYYFANTLSMQRICIRDLAFLSRQRSFPLAARGSGFLIDNLEIAAGLQDPTSPDAAAQCCPGPR